MKERKIIALRLVLIILIGSTLSFGPSAISVTHKLQDAGQASGEGNYLLLGQILLEIAAENPWWKSIWENAGNAFFQAGEFSQAIPPYEEALELDTISNTGLINLGTSYHATGDLISAETTWKSLEASPTALQNLAGLYEENDDLKSAIEIWKQYLTLVSDVQDEEIFHIALLLAAESPPDAILYLEQSGETYPAAIAIQAAIENSLLEEKAYQYVSSGQSLAAYDYWYLAAHAFEKAVFFRSDYPEAYLYWGEALQHIPEPENDPLDILNQGLALNETSPLANLFLGLYWQREGSHEKALDFFLVAEEGWPDRPDIYVEQGRSHAALGELEIALEKYQKAIELVPEEAVYYRQLADFCVKYSYQVREIGLPAARLAVQLENKDPANLDIMGQVLLALEDQMNAAQFFLRALEVDPGFSLAAYHLGILYSAQNNGELAVYYLQQALIHTTNPAVRDQAERLLSNYQ